MVREEHRSGWFRAVAGALWFALAATGGAHASSLEITYYTIAASDPDADALAFGTFDNEVQSSLGPDGLPVLNTAEYGCTTNCYAQAGAPGSPLGGTPNNINVVTSGPGAGEITYWAPALNPYVTETGTASITLPFSVPQNFFPPNGTGSADGPPNGYQAATLSGELTVPGSVTSETLSFNIGADDMAFAYLNGQVVCDLGGVHGSTAGTCTTATVGPGTYSLEVFFVDINQTQAGLTFGVNTGNVVTTPPPSTGVPEPSTLGLLALCLAALGIPALRASGPQRRR